MIEWSTTGEVLADGVGYCELAGWLCCRRASGTESTAVATLTCEEEVRMFASIAVEEEFVKVAVLSEEGNLFLFQLPVTTPPSSPLTHSYSVQFVSSPSKVGNNGFYMLVLCDLAVVCSQTLPPQFQCWQWHCLFRMASLWPTPHTWPL
jgi:hypothetical protein